MTTSNTELAAQARRAAAKADISAGCGAVMGHGESCVEGRLCQGCRRNKESADLLRQLADAVESKTEPVMIYRGRHIIDCGEFGSHDMEMLKLIPAGTKLYAAPVQPEKDERKPGGCTWAYEDEPTYAWRTGCGNLWAFTDGGPEDNGTKFCPYCGGSVGIGSSTDGGSPHE